MNRLQNKRALITGGTTGIGSATAREFLKEGARLAITGHNPQTLESARKELGSGVLAISSDASAIAAQKQLADTVGQAFGQLDILFLNAGLVDLRPIETWDDAAFDRSFAQTRSAPARSRRRSTANPVSLRPILKALLRRSKAESRSAASGIRARALRPLFFLHPTNLNLQWGTSY